MYIILINHMTKNYSTNKGYDNSSVRRLGVPPYQVGTSKLAGNAWNVHHTDLMVLLSSLLPLVWLRILLHWSIGPREWWRGCPVVAKIIDQPIPPSLLYIAILAIHYPRVGVRMWIFATDPRVVEFNWLFDRRLNPLNGSVLPVHRVLFEPGNKAANVRLTTLFLLRPS